LSPQNAAEQLHRHASGRPQRAGDEQQRIAGQERRHHQAGLAEDDREQDEVDPAAVLLQQGGEMLVEMDDDVPEPEQEFHRSARRERSRILAGRRYNRALFAMHVPQGPSAK
jgi:hypothetical protein